MHAASHPSPAGRARGAALPRPASGVLATLAVALLGVLLTGFTGPARVEAQGLADRRPRDDNTIEPGGYSLDDAVGLAQNRYRARAVKAETVEEGGRRIHVIRLLSDEGRVWTVRVDAASGRMQ